MHLLLAQKGSINESEEAIDLGQEPADLVFLTAADTEISSLAGAARQLGVSAPALRCANITQLSHPMSVDQYVQNTIAGSKLVIVRLLGGESYWAYGLETLYTSACRNNVDLVVVPGDDKPDPGLVRFNTLAPEFANRVWSYLIEGGPQNMEFLLQLVQHHLGRGAEPPQAVPLLKAGVWYPGKGICDVEALRSVWQPEWPVAAITFYRALVQSGGLAAIEAIVEGLAKQRLNALPVFVASLKDAVSAETVRAVFGNTKPSVVLNTTGFAVGSPDGTVKQTVLDEAGKPVLQLVLASGTKEGWEESSQGLSARDLAMNVALPEVDGRVFTRSVAFKNAARFDTGIQANIVEHEPDAGRIAHVCELAANWVRLAQTKPRERKVAVILANYPNRDGRLGNGVGLDTPAGTVNVLRALKAADYSAGDFPTNGDALMAHLLEGRTNSGAQQRQSRITISRTDYLDFFSTLPKQVSQEITRRWGPVENDPFYLAECDGLDLPVARFDNVVVSIQPARGYNIDPKESYHSPDLVPPHGYLAFYAWLRINFGAHALVHMGKHGNLEWLPGKALSLSENCYPEAILGAVPNLYPFIVNDPGEGTQAKRRISAVIIDHLTPPLTRAESYGPLRDLEALVDEYYEASGNDPRRLVLLKKQIISLIADIGLDADAGIIEGDSDTEKLEKLDGYLCELKEMQIRDGLHIFGESPAGRLETDLLTALVRVPRGSGTGENQSIQRAISADLGLCIDPLDCDMAADWTGTRPRILATLSTDPWRSNGDTVERIELLATNLVSGAQECGKDWTNTNKVLEHLNKMVRPAVGDCGVRELSSLVSGLDGWFVAPGPSGAPTRGRIDVLPTGKNFFSVDSRAVPTPAAWELGRRSAELLITRYRQDHGEWPKSFGLSVWGTSNMRTGGDDIAQAMALIGAKPVWDNASRRVTGYEVMTLAELGRPRVDVTLRISGFFRDAFPAQIELFDKAVRAIGALREEESENPIAARMHAEFDLLLASGSNEDEAARRSGSRIFGSKPGAYGAGLQALIDEKGWSNRADLAEAYLAWGSYAYGAREEGVPDRAGFKQRLETIEAVVHNQDNREHDLLDSDDYYQFEGGMTAAVEQKSGKRPAVYHNDHSRPEKPVVRALEEEIARVVRARAANPKWIAGVMRHGYKGAFEMAATLDYLFAFAATTGAVRDHHFELLHNAWLVETDVLDFLKEKNPDALKEMADRFLEAVERGLWTPRSNSAKFLLEQLAGN